MNDIKIERGAYWERKGSVRSGREGEIHHIWMR